MLRDIQNAKQKRECERVLAKRTSNMQTLGSTTLGSRDILARHHKSKNLVRV